MKITQIRFGRLVQAGAIAVLSSSIMAQQGFAQDEASSEQTIKFKLSTSGPDNEWIVIERSRNIVRLFHTTHSRENRGVGSVVNYLIDAVGPSDIYFSRWNDHRTTRVVFKPDNCLESSATSAAEGNRQISDVPSPSSSCMVTGVDTLVLPEATDLYQGQFTIEYIENDLLRSITFRIPAVQS